MKAHSKATLSIVIQKEKLSFMHLEDLSYFNLLLLQIALQNTWLHNLRFMSINIVLLDCSRKKNGYVKKLIEILTLIINLVKTM